MKSIKQPILKIFEEFKSFFEPYFKPYLPLLKSSEKDELIKKSEQLCSSQQWSEVRDLLRSESYEKCTHASKQEILDHVLTRSMFFHDMETIGFVLASPELKLHANVNGFKKEGFCPLYNACMGNSVEIVKLLMEQPGIKLKPDLKMTDAFDFPSGEPDHAWSQSAFFFVACHCGNSEVVGYLLNHPKMMKFRNELCAMALAVGQKYELMPFVQHLVYEVGMPNTREISTLRAEHPFLDNLFSRRELQDNLKENLPVQRNSTRRKL